MQEGYFHGVDGTRLFFRRVGEGVPLVLCDGIGCDGYVWRYFIPYFADRFQIVHWHYKGHGQSDRPADFDHIATADVAADLGQLFAHLNLPPGVLVGHSMGVQVILEFAHLFPERTRGLIPICGSYGRPLDTFHDNSILKTVFPFLKKFMLSQPELSQRAWELVTKSELAYQVAVHFEVNGDFINREDFKPYFDHIGGIDAGLFVSMLAAAQEHDAKPNLAAIACPTLVVGGEKDTFTPLWLSREMQKLIPDADLLVVPNGSHTSPIEMPELVNLRIEKFLNERILEAGQTPAADLKVKSKTKKSPAKKPARKTTVASA
ncbi:MAG: alpha/beta hydrolase [Myxococcales bacterium]|nr:MAG: alpha/beta hydrolase [Myxococcales bacterium]